QNRANVYHLRMFSRRFTPILPLFLLITMAPLGAQPVVPPVPTAPPTTPPAVPVAPPPVAPETLNSPHATMTTFIEAMDGVAQAKRRQDETGEQQANTEALRCLDLAKITNKDKAPELAAKLLGVINRLGPYQPWYLWSVDEAADNTAQTYFPHRRFDQRVTRVEPDGQVVLARQADGRWLFSADTVSGIVGLYISVEKLPVLTGLDEKKDLNSESWVRRYMPPVLKGKTFLTLEYWQWLLLAGFIFVGVVLDHTFRLIIRGLAGRTIRRKGGEADPQLMRQAVRPAGLLVMAMFWLYAVNAVDLPPLADTVIRGAARIFAVLAAVLFAWRLIDLVTAALIRKAEHTDSHFDDVLVPLVRKSLKILIVVFGVLYGAQALHIPIGPLLGALGIGGVGFAFAAKDTLENFFGSATVLIDQPFGVGDWIVTEGVEGTVEEIGFRSTRVRTFYNSLVTVPNSRLVRATVDNYGKRRYRRYKTMLGVEYGTSPQQVTAFVEGIREIIRTHPYTRKDYYHVYLNQFGPSSLDILLYMFFEVPDWSVELRERERLNLEIMRLADQLGVGFAFPTQTLHVVKQDTGAGQSPAPLPSDRADREAQQQGIDAAQRIMKDQHWRIDVPGPVTFDHGPVWPEDGDKPSEIENRRDGA
ncbi:MAG: mechanosensitive ion channel family protein, partial [Phycisphaerae bacterium]|nr:mechanosensitive ion channel family protein [Phycisphaerae bacterium]